MSGCYGAQTSCGCARLPLCAGRSFSIAIAKLFAHDGIWQRRNATAPVDHSESTNGFVFWSAAHSERTCLFSTKRHLIIAAGLVQVTTIGSAVHAVFDLERGKKARPP